MKRFLSIILSAALLMPSFATLSYAADNSDKNTETISYTYSAGNATTYTREMEKLDRGLIAISTDSGVYLSWRLLDCEDAVFGSANKNVSFNIYRDGRKIDTVATATNYTDSTVGSSYSVAPVIDGIEGKKCDAVTVMNNNYFDIPLVKPDAAAIPSYTTVNKWNYFVDSSGNIIYETNSDGSYKLDNKGKKIAVDWTNENVAYRNIEYTVGDCSCGDIDNDGEYEIIVKWDCGAQDNSFNGVTGNVIIDAYEIDGTFLWRIDLGKNIRAGAHYTQFLVYDFDGDGKAEITCKTAPNSKDSSGQYITKVSHISEIAAVTDSDNEVDYRNGGGFILDGDEYFTIFNGETGEAIDTIYYPNQRLSAVVWGDTYGGRVDRFTADVAYIDGEKPYAVYMRGYYMRQNGGSSERQTACAISFDGSQLSCNYSFDTYDVNSYRDKTTSFSYDKNGNYKGVDGYKKGNEIYVGQGNHNCTVADVDNDGKDEVITGALCYELDNNTLKPKWCTFMEHGDALHIGDYDTTHKGLEFFTVHEDSGPNTKSGQTVDINYGMSVIDAETGDIIKHWTAGKDTGRGTMVNTGQGGYYQVTASSGVDTYTANGNGNFEKASVTGGTNFRIFWDGDLYDELLDKTNITSWNGRRFDTIFYADSCNYINDSKANPALQADLFGDWREEVLYPTADNNALRVFSTTTPTEYKMKTLMHDPVYRSGVAAEQTAYNQPPHIGFYIDNEIVRGGISELQLTSIPKDTYKIGENLDLSGCTVTAIYANGTTETINIDDCTISGHNPYTDGKQTITVTYQNKNASFDITVLSGFECDRFGCITGYFGNDKSVIIPEYVDGIPVKAIEGGAFANTSVEEVYIYHNINIDDGTFPNGVTIYCFEGSLVHECAIMYNIPYKLISESNVYANVTFDEAEYDGYSENTAIVYQHEKQAWTTSIVPLTFGVGARTNNDGGDNNTGIYKKTEDSNSFLDARAGQFSTVNRHAYIQLNSSPSPDICNEFTLEMDFNIPLNDKNMMIALCSEISSTSFEDADTTIYAIKTGKDNIAADTWYHCILSYKNGLYYLHITDKNTNNVIFDKYIQKNIPVNVICFPASDVTRNTYVSAYLDNISLTSPLISTLTVNVSDNNGNPISNANIKLGNDISAITNINGQAVITAPVGKYPLTVEHNSYTSDTQTVHLRRNIEIKDITLSSTPVFDVSQHDLIIDSGLNNNTVICRYNGNEISYPAETVLTIKSLGNNTSNNVQINTPVTLALEATPTGNGIFAGWFDEENTPQAHSVQTTETFAAGQTLRAVFSPDGNPLIIGESKNSNGQKTVRIFIPKDKQCSVIAATYEPNGELTSVKLKDINEQNSNYLGTIGLIDDDQILKIMIWNSLNNMTPLCSRIYDSSQNN